MPVNVNPPPFLRLPPEFLKDKQTRAFIEQQNTIIFQLWNRLGGGTDLVSDLEITSNLSLNADLSSSNKAVGDLTNQQVFTQPAMFNNLEQKINMLINEISANQSAIIARLTKRVEQLENDLIS